MYNNNDYRNYLAHHGILGMHWGKRFGPPYPLGSGDHSVSEKKAGWRKSLGGGRNEEEYGRKKSIKKPSDISSANRNRNHEKAKKALKIAAAVGITAVAAYGIYKGSKYINARNLSIGKKALSDAMEDSAEITFADGSKLNTAIVNGKLKAFDPGNSTSQAGREYARQRGKEEFEKAISKGYEHGTATYADGSKLNMAIMNGKTKAFNPGDPNTLAGKEYAKRKAKEEFEEAISKGYDHGTVTYADGSKLNMAIMNGKTKAFDPGDPNTIAGKEYVRQHGKEEFEKAISKGYDHGTMTFPDGSKLNTAIVNGKLKAFDPGNSTSQAGKEYARQTAASKSPLTLNPGVTGNVDYNKKAAAGLNTLSSKASELTSQTSKVDSGEDYVKSMLKKSAENARRSGVSEREILNNEDDIRRYFMR